MTNYIVPLIIRRQPFRTPDAECPTLCFPQLITEKAPHGSFFLKAGEQGLEPRYSGPKPDVLPLDDSPMCYHLPIRRLLTEAV